MGVRLFVYSSFLEDAHSLFVTLLTLLSALIFVKGARETVASGSCVSRYPVSPALQAACDAMRSKYGVCKVANGSWTDDAVALHQIVRLG
jgi:hypothetical protein